MNILWGYDQVIGAPNVGNITMFAVNYFGHYITFPPISSRFFYYYSRSMAKPIYDYINGTMKWHM